MRRAGIIIASATIGGIAAVAWGLSLIGREIDEVFAVSGDWPFVNDGLKAGGSGGGGGGFDATGLRGSHKHNSSNRTGRGSAS